MPAAVVQCPVCGADVRAIVAGVVECPTCRYPIDVALRFPGAVSLAAVDDEVMPDSVGPPAPTKNPQPQNTKQRKGGR